jgi:hypothetical protein
MGWFSRSQPEASLPDEQAIARYKYMLRTAPPEALEQAHEEAFARLTPEQRRALLEELAAEAPPEERMRAKDDPQSLARLATRTEIRRPGALERIFGGMGQMGGSGLGMGSMIGAGLLASLAGSFIGTAIAREFFEDHPYSPELESGSYDPADQVPEENSFSEDSDTMQDSDFDDGGFGGDLV